MYENGSRSHFPTPRFSINRTPVIRCTFSHRTALSHRPPKSAQTSRLEADTEVPSHLSTTPSRSLPRITSIPLLRRLRTRTPTHTPLIMPPLPQPLLHPQLQLPLQLRTRLLPMNEIAEPASYAAFTAIESTARLSEIGHRRQLAVDGAGGVPAGIEGVAGGLGRVFVFEARVHVADEICEIRKQISLTLIHLHSFPTESVDLEGSREGRESSRSLLLSQTTTSSISPYLHISHQKSS